ncbi:malate dehydrogenase [Candidatus Bathyarchaeota archaeon]|nr:MAG: malate dehydrogenase [Candidatus Bathyarchaeota archaeon]
MITIIGSGRVGVSTASYLAIKELDDILLLDIVENLPQGNALDLSHMASILGLNVNIKGSNNYEDMKGSDLVLVTAGFPRKPGMTREELVEKNAHIVVDIADKIRKYAPDSIVILTTNPLDAMAYLMYKKLGFPREKVIGFSGVLDAGRLRYYAAKKLGISTDGILAVVLGQHGENMFPVPRLSTVYGKPLTELLSEKEIEEIVKETIQAGAVVTKLRGFSSDHAPGAGLTVMAESIKKNLKKVFLASVYLTGEYGVKDTVANVPVVLGVNGVEKIIEVPLNEEEKKGFMESVEAIKRNIAQIPQNFLKT